MKVVFKKKEKKLAQINLKTASFLIFHYHTLTTSLKFRQVENTFTF